MITQNVEVYEFIIGILFMVAGLVSIRTNAALATIWFIIGIILILPTVLKLFKGNKNV